jgi:tetratricopeptide (TPR) repeat protein
LLDDGQIAQAKKAAQHLDSLTPNSGTASAMLGQVALAEGHFSEALAEFRKTAVPVWNLIGTAMAEHSLGHATASQAALEQLMAKFSKTLAYQIAEVYGWRGEKDKALEWLERAYHQHDGGLIYLRHDHYLASLRDEPRYRALLQKLNLPPLS